MGAPAPSTLTSKIEPWSQFDWLRQRSNIGTGQVGLIGLAGVNFFSLLDQADYCVQVLVGLMVGFDWKVSLQSLLLNSKMECSGKSTLAHPTFLFNG